ncbi:hypothetical protein RIF29_28597 [Crotalaria pallida]|uniref:Uncharacterized protein n=1 Tax=Crotalaria pallida TaxID=3830 RepID=A0AAN9EDF1_CROPI
MKQHLAGEKGEVISCPKVPFDVRYRLREHLNQVSGSRKRGNSHIQEEQQNAREDNVRQHQENAPTQPLPTQAPTQPLPTQASMHPPPSGSGSGKGKEAEEAPLLDYDELEKMLYNDIGNPKLDLTEKIHDLNVGVVATAATGEINLDSFIQDDVNVNVASSNGRVNLDDENNDTWMH